MREGHGTSGFHTPAACCLRGLPSESMPFTSLLRNIYSKPHPAAQSRSADYNCRQRLLPAEHNHLAHTAAERHDPAPPLIRHVFPRKELDVRPSKEKRKARYDEQDSQSPTTSPLSR